MSSGFFAVALCLVLGQTPYLPTNEAYAWKQNVHAQPFSMKSFPANSFYIGLPFDDLAHPDLATKWLPLGWRNDYGPALPRVSSCLDHWVELKNTHGEICYAQWKAVGPVATDQADYVFGTASFNATTAMEVSPAVARYLALDSNPVVEWRFVRPHDVRPGTWLKIPRL